MQNLPNHLVFITLSIILVLVEGAPAGRKSPKQNVEQEMVPCETVDKYTINWFLTNELPTYASPLSNNALFYSRGMSEKASKFARRTGLTTIWDVWPCHLYNYHEEPSNKMRCIHADDNSRKIFYENMSQAFAHKARGVVKVMHGVTDYEDPPTDGIWAKIELPTLVKAKSPVSIIMKINEKESESEIYWNGPKSRRLIPRSLSSSSDNMQRLLQSSFSESCMALGEYAWFNKINW